MEPFNDPLRFVWQQPSALIGLQPIIVDLLPAWEASTSIFGLGQSPERAPTSETQE